MEALTRVQPMQEHHLPEPAWARGIAVATMEVLAHTGGAPAAMEQVITRITVPTEAEGSTVAEEDREVIFMKIWG